MGILGTIYEVLGRKGKTYNGLEHLGDSLPFFFLHFVYLSLPGTGGEGRGGEGGSGQAWRV